MHGLIFSNCGSISMFIFDKKGNLKVGLYFSGSTEFINVVFIFFKFTF